MKQAILIIAFENIRHLIDFVEFLDDSFHFYIHIDKKSNIRREDIDELESKENVILISRKYKINWGGLNLTKAILFLADEALKNQELEYIHVVSGADFPIKRGSEIINRLKKNQNNEFIEYFALPYSSWSDGGLDRMEYYYFTDLFNVKTSFNRKLVDFLISLQRTLNLKRRIDPDFPELYGGSTWWSLSAPCVRYILEYTRDNPGFLRRFKYTSIPDELFFQTIVMNSPYKSNVLNNNLRMILWPANATHPAVLDETNYHTITESDHLFARKFHSLKSQKLLHLIRENSRPDLYGSATQLLES